MRAIRRSKRHEDIVRQLAEANHPNAGRPIFPTMRELLCFAAVLGFERGKKRELDATTMEIDGRTFENNEQSKDLIYLLALADAKDAEVLRDENDDKCITIFEQYAEAGLDELAAWLKERPEDPNGDVAIIDALRKRGFLGQARGVDEAIHDVSF
jgi:dnd system-associated protein 4